MFIYISPANITLALKEGPATIQPHTETHI